MPIFARLVIVLPALLLGACAEIGSRPDASLSGSVEYPANVTLPANVSLRVTLLDASAGAEPVAEVVMEGTRPPSRYELRYDPRAVDSSHRYEVEAHLGGDGRLLLLTAERYPVITGEGGSRADIVLRPPAVATP